MSVTLVEPFLAESQDGVEDSHKESESQETGEDSQKESESQDEASPWRAREENWLFHSDRDETPVDAGMFVHCLEHFKNLNLNDAMKKGPLLRNHTFMGQILEKAKALHEGKEIDRQTWWDKNNGVTVNEGEMVVKITDLPASVCRGACRKWDNSISQVVVRFWALVLVLAPVAVVLNNNWQGDNSSMPISYTLLVWLPTVGMVGWFFCLQNEGRVFRQEDVRLAAIVLMSNCSTSSNRAFMSQRHKSQLDRCAKTPVGSGSFLERSEEMKDFDPDSNANQPWPSFVGLNNFYNATVCEWAQYFVNERNFLIVNSNGKSYVTSRFVGYYVGLVFMHSTIFFFNLVIALYRCALGKRNGVTEKENGKADLHACVPLLYSILTHVAMVVLGLRWLYLGWNVPCYLMLFCPVLSGFVIAGLFMEDVLYLTTARSIAGSFLHMLQDKNYSEVAKWRKSHFQKQASQESEIKTVYERETIFNLELYQFLTDSMDHGCDKGIHVLRAFDFLMMVKFFRMQFCLERLSLEATLTTLILATLWLCTWSIAQPLEKCLLTTYFNATYHWPHEDKNIDTMFGCYQTLSIEAFLIIWCTLGFIGLTLMNVGSALKMNSLFLTDLTNVLESWAEKIRWLLWSRQSEVFIKHKFVQSYGLVRQKSEKGIAAELRDSTVVLTNRLAQMDWAIQHLNVANEPVRVFTIPITPGLVNKILSALASVAVLAAPKVLHSIFFYLVSHAASTLSSHDGEPSNGPQS